MVTVLHTNEVTLHPSRLVPRWVTDSGYITLALNQPPMLTLWLSISTDIVMATAREDADSSA